MLALRNLHVLGGKSCVPVQGEKGLFPVTYTALHCRQVGRHQYYNLSLLGWASPDSRQAEEKLRHEKFPRHGSNRVLPARCLRGKLLFNFVWFDVKPGSCHFHPFFLVRC